MPIRIVERHKKEKTPPEILRMRRKLHQLKDAYKKQRDEGASRGVLKALEKEIEALESRIKDMKVKKRETNQVGLHKYMDIEKVTLMTPSEFRKLKCRSCVLSKDCQQTKERIMICAAKMK